MDRTNLVIIGVSICTGAIDGSIIGLLTKSTIIGSVAGIISAGVALTALALCSAAGENELNLES